MSEQRVIAEITSLDGWAGLIEGFRKACDARNTTYEATSELAGLPTRYVNKILAPVPVRNIGPKSLGPLLGALGVKILIIEDLAMLAALEGRFVPREYRPKRNANAGMPTRKRLKSAWKGNSQWGRSMRARALLNMTARQRSTWAKRAAKARWRKPHMVEIKGKKARKIRDAVSNCAIAKDIGVSHTTVQKARKQLSDGPPVQKRTGLDGKARPRHNATAI